jgi:hypothetical protein
MPLLPGMCCRQSCISVEPGAGDLFTALQRYREQVQVSRGQTPASWAGSAVMLAFVWPTCTSLLCSSMGSKHVVFCASVLQEGCQCPGCGATKRHNNAMRSYPTNLAIHCQRQREGSELRALVSSMGLRHASAAFGDVGSDNYAAFSSCQHCLPLHSHRTPGP